MGYNPDKTVEKWVHGLAPLWAPFYAVFYIVRLMWVELFQNRDRDDREE